MAEILPNSPNDVASRGVTNETLAQFKGLARQVVINIDDNFRPVIMDGLTLGGKSKVALVTDLKDYLPKDNPTFTGTLSGTNGTFTGTLSGTNGTFTGTLSLNGNSVVTQGDLEELQGQIESKVDLKADDSVVVKQTVQTLRESVQTQVLTNLGVIDALKELITKNGGTVPTDLTELGLTEETETLSTDPWAQYNE